MLEALIRTGPGENLVQFMRGPRGKKLDKFLVKTFGYSLLMQIFSAKVGFPPIPCLMIYTTGRKSGEERSTVMPYFEIDGRIYLIGSNGAKTNDPFWVENLRAKSEARIIVNRKERRVRARILEIDSEERARIWQHAGTKTPQYDTYKGMTSRQIPVVALE